MITRMKEKYQKEVVKAMMEKFGLKNKMQVPVIEKVIINSGIGKILNVSDSSQKKKILEKLISDFSLIAGQRPAVIPSRMSVAAFRLRQGMPVGLKATLRGQRMYDFLDRLVHIALPRVRDFRGLDLKLFDKNGNLNIGFKEHIIFPEITPEKLVFGLEVTIVVRRAKNKEQAIEFLRLMGFPLKEKQEKKKK